MLGVRFRLCIFYDAALDNKYIFGVEGTVIENVCVVLIFTDC